MVDHAISISVPNLDPAIHMFLGLRDPDPLGIDPDTEQDPVFLSSCKNSKKNLDSYYLFCYSF